MQFLSSMYHSLSPITYPPAASPSGLASSAPATIYASGKRLNHFYPTIILTSIKIALENCELKHDYLCGTLISPAAQDNGKAVHYYSWLVSSLDRIIGAVLCSDCTVDGIQINSTGGCVLFRCFLFPRDMIIASTPPSTASNPVSSCM